MSRSRFLAFTLLFTGMACFGDVSRADDAAKAAPAKKIQVLVLVGGHGFDEKPFHEVFAAFADMKCTFVEEKVGGEAFDRYRPLALRRHRALQPQQETRRKKSGRTF